MTELLILASFAACLLFSLIPGAIVHVGLRGPLWRRFIAGLSVCAILPIAGVTYFASTTSHPFTELIASEPVVFWASLFALIWLPGILFYEYARIKGSKYRHILGILAAIVFPIVSLILFIPAFHKIFPSPPHGVVIQSNVKIDPVTGLPPPPPSYNFPKAIDQDGKPLAYFSKECHQQIENAHAAGTNMVITKDTCPDE
jgi:hypothetical protein